MDGTRCARQSLRLLLTGGGLQCRSMTKGDRDGGLSHSHALENEAPRDTISTLSCAEDACVSHAGVDDASMGWRACMVAVHLAAAGGGGWSPGADVQACSLPPTVGARLLKKLTQLPVPHAFSLPSVSHKEGSCEVTHRQTGLAAPSYALTRRDVIWGHYCLAVGKPNRASSATDL